MLLPPRTPPAPNGSVSASACPANQVREIAAYADGVIVGTALVVAIGDGGVDAVASLTKDLSTGLTKEEA